MTCCDLNTAAPTDIMRDAPPVLESWYREWLRFTRFDISSSGVLPYGFDELRELLDLQLADLDAISMGDSVSFGEPGLRAALGERYAGGNTEWVMATHGSSEAIALVLSTILTSGQRVVVADPIYHSLRSHAEQRGCEIVRWPVLDLANDVERGCKQLVLPGTTAVIVNFPHNPTGAMLDTKGVERLLDACERVGAWLIWDGAMEELVMEPTRAPLVLPIHDRLIRFGTLSKAFGLPGLRVGWCIAPPPILTATLALRDRTTLFLSPLVEAIAMRAIQRADRLIEPPLARARQNLHLVSQWMTEHERWVNWRRPEGGVCGLIHVNGLTDTQDFCEKLVDHDATLLVPGRAFETPGAVRLGYGGATKDLELGLERLAARLSAIVT